MTTVTSTRRRTNPGAWGAFIALTVITAVMLVPILATIILSLRPKASTGSTALFTFANFAEVIENTMALHWLSNSLLVALVTVVISIAIAAPGGYVISRGRSRAVAGYSLALFVVQSLPIVTAVIPLFILFAQLGLVDNLGGVTIVYIGTSIAVATWMMGSYFDSIPIDLEEAAWLDGCSVLGSFFRVVLRNSLPGVLSTAIFTFLLAWNDYLIALVFLKSDPSFTLPVGLQSFFQQNSTDWESVMAVSVLMMLPPIVIFAFLNRYFSVGGVGGALAGK